MYPQNEVTISISQIANGWMVMLPVLNPMQFPNQLPLPLMTEKEIRRQAKIMKDEMMGDDLLKKIQEENAEPEITPEPTIPTINDLKIENVYTFKTFPEVLEFLKEKVK